MGATLRANVEETGPPLARSLNMAANVSLGFRAQSPTKEGLYLNFFCNI